MRRSAAALVLALLLPLPGLAGEVVVKPGETLSELAERYGTSVNRLMQLNGLSDAKGLQAGSRLQVPGGGSSSSGSTATRGRSSGGSITVKAGETLSEIAERNGTTVERLMQINGLRDAKGLQAGSRLQLPGSGGRATTASGGSAGGTAPYTVKAGETLSELAERYGTSVDRLMQINGLRDAKGLQAGSRLQVPGSSASRASVTTPPPAPVNRNARQHQVKPGETLSEIADRYGVPLDRLISLNGLRNPNDLQVNTTLQLRSAPPVSAAKPKPKPPSVASKPSPKPSAQPASKAPATASAKPATTAAAQPPAQTTAKPAATPTAKPAATAPAAKPAIAAAAPAAKPAATPQPAARPKPAVTTAAETPVVTSSSAPSVATAKPATTTMTTAANTANTTSKPVATPAAKPTVTTTTSAQPAKPAAPDWRSYGPLQIDWANWQPMGGSYVAPTLNSEGQPLYLAINCSARRLNATGQSGTWKTWDAPQSDFEEQLITDLCKAKGS